MIWNGPYGASDVNSKSQHYDNLWTETPVGTFVISWKSWKEHPAYTVEIVNEQSNNEEYLCTEFSIEDSKEAVIKYLFDLSEKLKSFVEDQKIVEK